MDILNDALKQGVTPAIVIAVYLIITKIIDSRKDNIQMKLSSDLTKSINIISSFIINLTKNIIDKDKEKCKNAIEDSMYSSGLKFINFVSTTIINNNIDINKENIITNIHNIVNTEYHNIYSSLSTYTINNIKVSDKINDNWEENIEKVIIDVIYNNNLSKDEKIILFINRINTELNMYITELINNVFDVYEH